MYMQRSTNTDFQRKQTKNTIDCKKLTDIRGFEFTPNMMMKDFVKQFHHLGYQASNLSQGVEVIQEMVEDKCDVYVSVSSNISASGLRDMLAQLIRDKKISCLIVPANLIDEDIMKTFSTFKLGEFDTSEEETSANKITRVGNVFIPDEHYLKFEGWHHELMQTIHKENKNWTAHEYVKRLGMKLKDENSILYWAAKRGVNIFITDLSSGTMEKHWNTFNQSKKGTEKLTVDNAISLKALKEQLSTSAKKGGLILGGDVSKNILLKEALVHGGLDYAIFVNTGILHDGSLNVTRSKETALWDMLKNKKNIVHVECETTIALPLLMTGFYS